MRGLVVLPLVLVACKRPPDAPAELDELVGYYFEKHQEEDPAPLQEASYNLDAWLDIRLEETLEGYAVNNLTAAAVSSLEDGERSLEGLAGAAVGAEHGFGVEQIALVAAMTEQDLLYPETYTAYERHYLTDPDCFASGACDDLEFEAFCSTDYDLIQVDTHSLVQWRRIDTEFGPAMVERAWLHMPATVTPDWVQVKEQFYLWAFIPHENGSRSIQATWVVAEFVDMEVPESFALDLVINSMAKSAETLEAYVAAGG